MKIYTITSKPYLKLRILATIIDYGIFMILFVIYIFLWGEKKADGAWEINGLPTLLIPLTWFLYFVVTEKVNQATPGHDICGLRVVKPDGRNITLSDAFKRRVCDPLDIFFYGLPAIICISNTDKHQRIGDLLANTLIVKKTDIIETGVIF